MASRHEGIPGSYGREYPWPTEMEDEPLQIILAAKEYYEMWKKLFETKANFVERARKVDDFFRSHEVEDIVGLWMESYDLRWDKVHTTMLREKAHQDWQKEHGKRS